jgi:hypothetical protein
MAFALYSVIRRHMKYTGRYFELGSSAQAPVVAEMSPEEHLLGWYRNPAPWEDSVLVFTDEAIYSIDGESVARTAIADIVWYESPKSKTDVTGVRVRTRDGFRFLRASGSFGPHGNQKDAFCLIPVIMAIARRNHRLAEGGTAKNE